MVLVKLPLRQHQGDVWINPELVVSVKPAADSTSVLTINGTYIVSMNCEKVVKLLNTEPEPL